MATGWSKLITAAAAFLIFGLISGTSTYAEVATDGTVGPRVRLGGDFEIGADLGRRAGGNLFHSFERFSLDAGERATFTGPDQIRNVISRVTGGTRSDIDGTLRSTIPGADFYFLNPAGVMFGPNASLDVQGSFHVSTADELRFEGGAKFSATNPTTSSFTVAAPEAFGFLGDDAGSITLRGAGLFLDPPDVAPFDTTISLVGGDITLDQSQIIFVDVETATGPEDFEQGNVNLVAMSRPGRVSLDGRPSAAAQGTISIIGQGINVSTNNGGGRVRIHAGDLMVDGGFIASDNGFFGSLDPNNGDGPKPGGIEINAERMRVLNGGLIQSNAFGAGEGGDIVLRVNELDVINEVGADTRISSDTQGAGRAGNISILNAHSVRVVGDERFRGPTEISSDVAADPAATGRGGDIVIQSDRVIVRNDGFITSSSQGPGDAGSITIEAGRVSLERGGQIAAATGSTGSGGSITVNAREEILITGDGPFSPVTRVPEPSGILATSESEIGGRAGDVRVTAQVIRLADRGEIGTAAFGQGDAGDVHVRADRLTLRDGQIDSLSFVSGGGRITVLVDDLVDLREGEIESSVLGGVGTAAGNITINARFLVLDRSSILAQAAEGRGGNIRIAADNLILAPDGLISASAGPAGISGTIMISTPEVDLSGGLVVLEGALLDAASQVRERCGARRDIGASSFTGVGRGGLPPTPDGPLASAYLVDEAAVGAARKAGSRVTTATATADMRLAGLSPPCAPMD